MATESHDSLDVAVIGAGPAGLVAALRAARLGARTALITSDALGGMAANNGPVPVRTLAHAARLIREARSLPRFGVTVGDPAVRLPAPPNHRRPPDRILQTNRRPRGPHHRWLPHRRRACGRTRATRGHRDGLQDDD